MLDWFCAYFVSDIYDIKGKKVIFQIANIVILYLTL